MIPPVVAGGLAFCKFVAGFRAELKSRKTATVDRKLLDIDRKRLDNAFADFKDDHDEPVAKAVAAVRQDAAFRNIGNTTPPTQWIREIETAAEKSHDRATRDYNLAVAEIELLKEKL